MHLSRCERAKPSKQGQRRAGKPVPIRLNQEPLMFNNLCLAQRAAEPLQLALIESRAGRRPKHILTAQLPALKERALGRGAPRRAPTNSPGCAQYGRGVWGGGCLRILSHAKHTAARTDISSDGLPTCSAGAGVSALTGRRRGQPRQPPPGQELQEALRRSTSWKGRRAGEDKNHARGRADRAPLQSSHQHASRAAEPQLRTVKARHRCLIPE